jgi:hypothetical protein
MTVREELTAICGAILFGFSVVFVLSVANHFGCGFAAP